MTHRPAPRVGGVLADVKRTLGSYDFSAQYQQSPAPPGGAMIRLAWFSRYPLPARSQRGGHDRAELGHRRQGYRDQRLFRLHDVVHAGATSSI